MKNRIIAAALLLVFAVRGAYGQEVRYVKEFSNEHHPEIGYWFISPSMLEGDRAIRYLDSVADRCLYTFLFLSAREGVSFFDYGITHDAFKRIVAEGHKRGLKIGLQIWGNTNHVPLEVAERMIVEQEVTLDEAGSADYTAKAKYI
ncbi:MAG TPA: hypothetical protein VHC48_07385, partial [Puia sp.]|nr:hypothetical protein [Puia sp.]